MGRMLKDYTYGIFSFLLTYFVSDKSPILLILLIFLYAYLANKNVKDSLVAALVYSIIMFTFYDAVYSIIYISSYVGLGIILGYMFNKKMNSYKTIMGITMYIFSSFLITLYAESTILKKGLLEFLKELYLQQNVNVFESFGYDGAQMAKFFLKSFIGIYFINAFILATISYFIIKLLVKLIHNVEMESIKYFKVEGFNVIEFAMLLIALIVVKNLDPFIGEYIFYGALLSFFIIFVLQGFSLLYWFINKKIESKFISFALSFIFSFIFPGLIVASGIGFSDSLFNMRKVNYEEKK